MSNLGWWTQRSDWQLPTPVIVTERTPGRTAPDHFSLLGDAGIAVTFSPLHDATGAVAPAVRSAEILITGGQPITARDVAQLERCRFVLRPYVGYDDIDVEALTARGILLANIPDAFSEEVAIHTLSLILAFNRFLFAADRYVRDGSWAARRQRADIPIHHPRGQTLGLIGFGVIGRLVAERARPFGFHVIAHDIRPSPAAAARLGVEMVALDNVLVQSDFVSLHVFLSPQTFHLMSTDQFSRMKTGAVLINTSRGKVVDEAALQAALQSGRLRGAGLDVVESEPIDADHPLSRLPNVILTPHMASQSAEGQVRIRERANEIALRVARGALPERHVVINKGLFDTIAAIPLQDTAAAC